MRGLSLLLSLLCASAVVHVDAYNDDYSLHSAHHYVIYSYSAYCQEDALSSWSCFWCNNVSTPLEVTNFFSNPATNTFGFAGYSDSEIVVSFRGTQKESLENWITDLNAAKTTPYKNVPGAEVHDGFYTAYMTVATSVRKAVQALVTNFPDLPVVCTGHSLGGALTQLAAIDIVEELSLSQPVYVWNFGGPRVGNPTFATYYNGQIKHTWRSINQRDIVPHLPPLILGFFHTNQEVWYANSTNHYTICGLGEDPDCSDSLHVALSITDHLTYLGLDEREGKDHNC